MKELKNLKRVAQEELEKLDAQYANKSEFTAADAEMYKCLTMALEKQMRIEQIENEMGYSEGYGDDMSGRRGQYMSRDGWNQNQQSGHYPPPWYPERGRW